MADTAASGVVDGRYLGLRERCVIDLNVVNQTHKGTVVVTLLADGKPRSGVCDRAVPRGLAGDGRLEDAVVVDLRRVVRSPGGGNQRPLVERKLGGGVVLVPTSVPDLELDMPRWDTRDAL